MARAVVTAARGAVARPAVPLGLCWVAATLRPVIGCRVRCPGRNDERWVVAGGVGVVAVVVALVCEGDCCRGATGTGDCHARGEHQLRGEPEARQAAGQPAPAETGGGDDKT